MTAVAGHAIQFDESGQAVLVPVEVPTAPGAGELIGTTVTSLISPGTELAVAANSLGQRVRSTGYAAIFRVDTVGEGVENFTPGDIAFGMGPHRTFQQCAAADAIALPDGLAFETAPFCRLMGVSMSTLTTTTARPRERVLVTGLGIVGLLAAQVFQLCGYEVAACDPVESRRELAAAAGVRHLFPATPSDQPEWRKNVALALECSGHEQAALEACHIVRRGGEVVLVGVPWRRRTEFYAHDILNTVFHNYVHLRSGWEWQLPRQPREFSHNSIRENLQAALQWLAEGRMATSHLHDTRSPSECSAVYNELAGGSERLTTLFDWR